LDASWIVAKNRSGIQKMPNKFIPRTVSGDESPQKAVGHPNDHKRVKASSRA
jgi:hypothetical protein